MTNVHREAGPRIRGLARYALAAVAWTSLAACSKSDDSHAQPKTVIEPKPAKLNEAVVHLDGLAKRASAFYRETGAFPRGAAPKLPAPNDTTGAVKGCCGTSDGMCKTSSEWASDPVWRALGFSIEEPTMYRYAYESTDGKTYTAIATGDTDCDGVEATFKIEGAIDPSGKPTAVLSRPPNDVF